MSIKSWKEEFYPVPVYKCKKKDALAHSLLKWTGLLPSNLKRHGLTKGHRCVVDKAKVYFSISGRTCALCRFYSGCAGCPLPATRKGYACDERGFGRGAPWASWLRHRNPNPMLKIIKQAITLKEK